MTTTTTTTTLTKTISKRAKLQNISKQYSDPLTNVTAGQYVRLWFKYDENGDNQISGSELEKLLIDLMRNAGLDTNETNCQEYKKALMEVFDTDKDGKINFTELSEILQVQESYLAKFQSDHKLTSVEFIEIFNNCDEGKKGFLNKKDLNGFVFQLLQRELKQKKRKEKIEPKEISDYVDNLLEIFDENKDNKIDMNEFSRILPVQESFFVRYKGLKKLDESQCKDIFDKYDQVQKDGILSGAELTAFCRDLLQQSNESPTSEDLALYEEIILSEYAGEDESGLNFDNFKKMLQTIN